jgi:hypothetical protein
MIINKVFHDGFGVGCGDNGLMILEVLDEGPAPGAVQLRKYIIEQEYWFLPADFFD